MTSIKRLLNEDDQVFGDSWSATLNGMQKSSKGIDAGTLYPQLPYVLSASDGLREPPLSFSLPRDLDWTLPWDGYVGKNNVEGCHFAIQGAEAPNELPLPPIVQDDIELWTADTFLPSEETLSHSSMVSTPGDGLEQADMSICFGMVGLP